MKLLGIDPGKLSGVAAVTVNEGGYVVNEAKAVTFADLPHYLHDNTMGQDFAALILEGWETQGRRIDGNCRYAMESIGTVRMWALTQGVPVVEVYASWWKPSFSRGFELVKVPFEVKARKPERALAHACYHRMKIWPPCLAKSVEPERGHIINAVALALLGEHVWKRSKPRAILT